MDQVKPRIGLLLFSAEWFRQIGADRGSFAGLGRAIQDDASRIRAALEPYLDIVGGEVLDTRDQVAGATRRLLAQEVDGIIVCNITWGEDRLLIDALDHLSGAPLLLWCYTPFERLPKRMDMSDLLRATGAVGALQASGPLKRLGRKPVIAIGSSGNKHTVSELLCFARAAKVARDLKKLRIGVLPYRCDQMTGTYVDEFRLRHELGPELIYISVGEYQNACQAIAEDRVRDFVGYLRSTFSVQGRIQDAALARSARATLGLAKVAADRCLGAVALEDVSAELHRVMGLRPCLYSPEIAGRFVVSMEADVCGAISVWLLKALTAQPAMYAEIFTFDEAENEILIGHAGLHDLALASSPKEVFIEPDGEYQESEPESCWMSFRVKPGTVTLLSTFCDVDKFKLVVSDGESLPGERKLWGSPHACVRLRRPVHDFLKDCLASGMTQHWGMVHGQAKEDLAALGRIADLDIVSV